LTKDWLKNIRDFAIFPPCGAIRISIDTIVGKSMLEEFESDENIEVDSIGEYPIVDEYGDTDLFLKKLKRGDIARTLYSAEFDPALYGNWGEVWRVNLDGMLDLKYTLDDNDMERIVHENYFVNPRISRSGSLMISTHVMYTIFKDSDEIMERTPRERTFNFEHHFVFKYFSTCPKCKETKTVMDVNQWDKDQKREVFRCIDCLPDKIHKMIKKIGTVKESHMTKEHLDVMLGPTRGPNQRPELPEKEDFDIVDELDSILDSNKPFKRL
jgi:hypothetical protein